MDKISLLYDHYKETCSTISDAIKRRDRLMLLIVVTLGFFAFQTIFPEVSDTIVNDFLHFKFGLSPKFNLAVIGNVVWFLILIFTTRYFQVSIYIERQYKYIHQIEDKLNKILGDELITREGKNYLKKYALFSNWMWALYTIIFPLLLLSVVLTKIFTELRLVCTDGWSYSLFLDTASFFFLAISVTLYLLMIHRTSKN